MAWQDPDGATFPFVVGEILTHTKLNILVNENSKYLKGTQAAQTSVVIESELRAFAFEGVDSTCRMIPTQPGAGAQTSTFELVSKQPALDVGDAVELEAVIVAGAVTETLGKIRMKRTGVNTGEISFFPCNAGVYSGTPALIIKSDGKVGVNTSTPTTALDVNGTLNATTVTQGGGGFSALWGNVGVDIFYNAGNVGIGPAFGPGTPPTVPLDVDGNIRTTSQLVSTVVTGTAPVSVSSTTVCPNLNAALLNGLTWAPLFAAALGAVTPATGIWTDAASKLVTRAGSYLVLGQVTVSVVTAANSGQLFRAQIVSTVGVVSFIESQGTANAAGYVTLPIVAFVTGATNPTTIKIQIRKNGGGTGGATAVSTIIAEWISP